MKDCWQGAVKISRALWYEEVQVCTFCGEVGDLVCPTCSTNYLHPELGRCRGCGKLILKEKTCCLDCGAGRGPQHLDQVTAWGHYSGALREFIQKIKFEAHPRRIMKIARPFADWAISQLPAVDGVVAVPMHASRLAERGFNQAEVLASAIHWELGLPIIEGVERIKPTPSQILLSRRDRLHNLKDAFLVREPRFFSGRSVWIVDDVTTTGATFEAVAEVLRSSGVQEIYGLCLAAGLEIKLVPLGN
ncbi:ComF family protein [Desulfosporosinus fructosivorans]|uniref:ComF family protein n=1 Tax=Desulfosporosinus fructosivorans TaxID=2018669 RepID=A0A4Z0R401_9FIRM|nr:ComF family protein [Desulfosporosinus fructosivorans]TGE36717.1 ComF family protein [Desulfosporosinus fructosivorans]